MKRISLFLLISIFIPPSIFAYCEPHYINYRQNGGKLLILEDGTKWEVLYGDEVDSNKWLLTDEILLCDDDLITHPEDDTIIVVRHA